MQLNAQILSVSFAEFWQMPTPVWIKPLSRLRPSPSPRRFPHALAQSLYAPTTPKTATILIFISSSVSFACPRTSSKWTHNAGALFSLTSFTPYNDFEIRSHVSVPLCVCTTVCSSLTLFYVAQHTLKDHLQFPLDWIV